MRSTRILLCLLIGFIAIWQCSALNDLIIFNNGLSSGFSLVTDQPSRISCAIANGKGINGGKAVAALTTKYALYDDNCYIKFNSGHGSISGYTELEFFIKSSPINAPHGYAGVGVKDANNHLETEGSIIPTTYTRFRFPLRNTFDGVSLNNLLSPFYLQLFLVKDEALYADRVLLRSKPYFDIYTDNTDQGREVVYSWGDGPSCFNKHSNSAPEGDEVLSVPAYTWGCGLFYSDPYIDLSYFSHIQFYLKSDVDVLIEIQSSSQKKGITVNDTNNAWKLITLNLSQFGLNLQQTYGPFLINKVADSSKEVQVDAIRYIPAVV